MRVPYTATAKLEFLLVDATDLQTPETGEAGGQPQISIDHASYTNSTNTLVHLGNGRYSLELDATEKSANSFVDGRYKSANTAEAQSLYILELTAEDPLTTSDIPTVGDIADAVWDETIPGAHVSNGTAGKLLLKSQESTSVRDGTLQAGSTASTVVLDSGASAVNNFYDHNLIVLTGGTGAGQVRALQDYVGSTKTATIKGGNWATTPDATTTFSILTMNAIHVYGLDDDVYDEIASTSAEVLPLETAILVNALK